jgi:hypothetical protein
MQVHNKRAGKTPAHTVYVGRPTKWGNPFSVERYGRAEAIEQYKRWVIKPAPARLRQEMREQLRGKDLECWCAPEACHAHVIAFIANTLTDPQ